MLKYNEYIIESKSAEHPFIQAVKRGSSSKVLEFIKKGVDINMKESYGKTALMFAVSDCYLAIVNILIDNGADPNFGDSDNRTALMMSHTMKIIDKLLSVHNIDVNIRNINNETVAMESLKYNWADDQMVILLEKFLEKGLNLDVKDKLGRNFYDILKHKERFKKTEDYMNKKFPQYKEEWEINQEIKMYNL